MRAVPFPARFQAFFQHQPHSFAQRENQRDGRRVMVEAVLAPIIHRRRQVEIPALHFCLALAKNFFGGRTDGDRRHSRGRTDGFLRTAETNVDAFAVHVQRQGCQRGHGVHHEERANFVGELSIRFDSSDDACRSFSMRQPDNFDLLALGGAAHVFRINRLAVRGLDLDDFRRSTNADLIHALRKYAVHGHDALVALFQSVQYRRFDPAGARSRKWHGDPVFRLKNLTHQDLRLFHAALEPWIHVPYERRGHRAVHARIDRGGSRSQHQTNRRVEFTNGLRHEILSFFFQYISRVYRPRAARGDDFGEASCHGGNSNFRAITVPAQRTNWTQAGTPNPGPGRWDCAAVISVAREV